METHGQDEAGPPSPTVPGQRDRLEEARGRVLASFHRTEEMRDPKTPESVGSTRGQARVLAKS